MVQIPTTSRHEDRCRCSKERGNSICAGRTAYTSPIAHAKFRRGHTRPPLDHPYEKGEHRYARRLPSSAPVRLAAPCPCNPRSGRTAAGSARACTSITSFSGNHAPAARSSLPPRLPKPPASSSAAVYPRPRTLRAHLSRAGTGRGQASILPGDVHPGAHRVPTGYSHVHPGIISIFRGSIALC